MNARLPGAPDQARLKRYRIWDSYFTPAFSSPGPRGERLLAEIERTLPVLEKARIERACIFPHVGLGTCDAASDAAAKANPALVMKPFERWPGRLIGMIQLNAAQVPASLDALNRWLRDGPMVGVYLPAGPSPEQCCAHPNARRLIERAAELGGVIMQHTWFITGGKRYPGMSTPSELAEIAADLPEAMLVCAHAGGEWEKGIRAVRAHPNIRVETSGFDATSGFVEMAVRELGPERIVFGSHLPSRSLGTELSKVIAADIPEAAKARILGGNYRAMLSALLRRKGL